MFHLDTLRECFVHNDWARDCILTAAADLADEQLDHPFAMGPGSLRATLQHLYGAERIWFERWQGTPQAQFPHSSDMTTIASLGQAHRALAQVRNADLADADPAQALSYTNTEGRTFTLPIGGMLLHVCNHGVHHRAQALNMLRQLGGRTQGLDYVFLRIAHPTIELPSETKAQLTSQGFMVAAPTAPAKLDVATLQTYFRYGDWAQEQALAAAESLSDEQLDRPFEMGVGMLRRTLIHVRDAEEWWYSKWTVDPRAESPKLPATTTIAELRAACRDTAARRDAYARSVGNAALQRIVGAYAPHDILLQLRLGESMLQCGGHGTHHRAQALNMLRHVGATVPKLDMQRWLVSQASTE